MCGVEREKQDVQALKDNPGNRELFPSICNRRHSKKCYSLRGSKCDRTQKLETKMDDIQPVAVSNVFHLDDENDKDVFFSRLARLDVNNFPELKSFLGNYKLRKLQVSGLSSEFVIVGRDESAVFDDYVLDVWRKYYIEEEVVQIGIIQAKLPFPLEVSNQ